ncbi:histidine phosphatase family protein [Pseudomonas baltica]|uniref:histidine phosphatase family protein n=1 Tax=Pseudomonas baltica TaxID=2762576 RepID=UPI00289907B3|nr:histidine phosphatase family protein [Pseudomonas baltica]
MNLYVVRHGETWANAERRYLGSLDPELTEHGRQQAQALAMQLPEVLDTMIVSPRRRARETAAILNGQLNLPCHIMDCFQERNVGVFEGLTQGEAEARYPQLWAQNITRHWEIGPTAGESIAQVAERVLQGLIELAARYPHSSVLLVAHGFVAKVIRALAKADFADFYDWQLCNGSLLALTDIKVAALDLAVLKASLPR